MKQMLDTSVNQVVQVLSADDFDDYDYNKPGDNWELVRYANGLRVWCPKNQLAQIN